MTNNTETRKNEVSFCADVKAWAQMLFAQHPEWPFGDAHIEEYGTGNNKRQDLRILDREHRTPILSGEVKMPGTLEGRTPYNPELMLDASQKAENCRARFFFTWNVNTFVLFDRSLWDKDIYERRLKEWDLHLDLRNTGQCRLPEVEAYIRDTFLPQFFAEFADIVLDKKPDWAMPPDEVFIRSLESHLRWPLDGTRDFLAEQCKDKVFLGRFCQWLTEDLQWSVDPKNVEHWRKILDRATRTLCYVFCNRAIFYDAIRPRYEDRLPKLKMPSDKVEYEKKYRYFRECFADAVDATGDYEPVFYPHVDDWVGALVFGSPHACQGWKGVLANLDQYNFRDIPHDIIGGIFQKLIAPEERQKFGQFFTHEDIVDVINAFCIRRGGDTVLDPACGSGSFLVRAYHRKAWLGEHRGGGRRHQDPHKTHQELLQEVYGCDIALFPAHLATLNLASRHIEDEDNYPIVRRGNFFEVIEKPEAFYSIPMRTPEGGKTKFQVALPMLDAIVGNPPYVRQELIPKLASIKRGRNESDQSFESRQKNSKEHLQYLASSAWPGLVLTGRSDLHCYFWPVATKRLKEGGYFGFLTSSSWLDVEYGFPLQGWILSNFKLLAILESVDEPWFEDARVKTCVAILQRCSDEKARNDNVVKFVRLQVPLAAILGDHEPGDESARQEAAMKLRQFIDSTKDAYTDERLRIIPVPQADLWKEGVEAGKVLAKVQPEPEATDEDDAEEESDTPRDGSQGSYMPGTYAAGKWGRFVRAPDIYFKIMRQYGARFVKFGEIADIRFGIKSGCDAFFMPRDVTKEILGKVRNGLPWNDVGLMSSCTLKEIESGKVSIVQAGDKTRHPVETEYLRPEVHSLMSVDRPVVRARDLDRVVLWVKKPLKELTGTHVASYIRWGAKQTFASNKSKAVPVPERSTCEARPTWYDLTNAAVGVAFWPMAQKYRHIVPANPDGLVCNHNLFYIMPALAKAEATALAGALNSTITGLVKHFFGRYAGAEGTLKTEVVDTLLLQVPDPRGVSEETARRISKALRSMGDRPVTHLVEDALLECHSSERLREILASPPTLPKELQQEDRRELDDAVLELMGVSNPKERKTLLDELYLETTLYYRYLRTQDIQSMENRATGKQRKLTAEDIAASIWDSLDAADQGPRLVDWLAERQVTTSAVQIPDGKAKALGRGHMFSSSAVEFAQGKSLHQEEYAGPGQAALVATLANLDIRGSVEVPADDATCKQWRKDIEARLKAASERLDELAATRTGDHSLREGVVGLLKHWYVVGKERQIAKGATDAGEHVG